MTNKSRKRKQEKRRGRINQKKAKQKQKRNAFIKAQKEDQSKGEDLLLQLDKAIKTFFPNLYEKLEKIPDPRKRTGTYHISEIVFAAIALTLFKMESRNHFNQMRQEGKFARNFKKLFKMKPPHMDTVDRVLRELDPQELTILKEELIKRLIRMKTFHKYRFLNRWFLVAIDGTGVLDFSEEHCSHCVYKTRTSGKNTTFQIREDTLSKLEKEGLSSDILRMMAKLNDGHSRLLSEFEKAVKATIGIDAYEKHQVAILKHCGKTHWFHPVLEAKLITPSGFSMSLGSEWIENAQTEYDKQDCELKAFYRLSKRIKYLFKRLPICILADALYANQTVFNICKDNGWEFIICFKKGSLPSVWQEVGCLLPVTEGNTDHEIIVKPSIERNYTWINEIDYQGHYLNWVECLEKTTPNAKNKSGITRYVFICSVLVNDKNVREIIATGRLRQKIENEGFNTQKNLGYNMTHKYSRVSWVAAKNFYQALQIAHIFNQLVELSVLVKKIRQQRYSIRFLWFCMIAVMIHATLTTEQIDEYLNRKTRYQLE